jgi:hypothetical protein
MAETTGIDGLLNRNLVRVDGDLVANYNRSLEAAVGKTTKLAEFSIDKRGYSPEIAQELGSHYLQSSPANRFVIVITPEQRNADLIKEDFSYDNAVLDFLFKQHITCLESVTKVDGLYGKLVTGINSYDSMEDLLLLKGVDLELHTPSNFITQALDVQTSVKQLKADPNLLTSHDSELPKKLYELAKQVGDVRGYNISNMAVHAETGSFYTRLFDGVYVFNPFGPGTAKPKRPSRKMPKSSGNVSIFLNKNFVIQQYAAEAPEEQKITVIYGDKSAKPKSGPKVQFISLSDTEDVIEYLITNNLAVFDEKLIQKRLSRLEDLALAEMVTGSELPPAYQRDRLLDQHKDELPTEWSDLRQMQREMIKGHDFNKLVLKASPEIQTMLLQPAQQQDDMHIGIVGHLLTKLWQYDYEAMRQYNPRDLEHAFEAADDKVKQYILSELKK